MLVLACVAGALSLPARSASRPAPRVTLGPVSRPAAVRGTVQGQPGVTYRVETSARLGGGGAWDALTNVTLAGTAGAWEDALLPGPARFYRAAALPVADGVAGMKVVEGQGAALSGGDGAVLYLPPRTDGGECSVTFRRTTGASGEVTNGLVSVSAEYEIRLASHTNLTGKVYLSMPLDPGFAPAVTSLAELKARLVPEFYDRVAGVWRRAGTVWAYDPANRLVTFDVDLGHLAVLPASGAQLAGFKPAYDPTEWEIVAGLSARQRWRQFAAGGLLDEFPAAIHYFDPVPPQLNSVPEDTVWTRHSDGPLTGHPNYVLDLWDSAYRAFGGLYRAADSRGNLVFGDAAELTVPIFVMDLGAFDGGSPVGGPVLLTNSRINNWPDLRTTVAHELVHYLQGQKYSSFEAGNRWFIEATAQYYASVVAGYDAGDPMATRPLPTEERTLLFSGTGNAYLASYLTVPIFTADDASHYAMGHFLGFLERRFPGIVGDVLNRRGTWLISSGKDLDYLESALKERQAAAGNTVGAQLADYIHEIVRLEVEVGAETAFANAVKEALTTATQRNVLSPSAGPTDRTFGDRRPYKMQLGALPPLSARRVAFLPAQLKRDALLVVAVPYKLAPDSDLESMAYAHAVVAPTRNHYPGRPLDFGRPFPYSSPLAVTNFGPNTGGGTLLFEHVIVNRSDKLTSYFQVDYYALERPAVLSVQASSKVGLGEVTWSTEGVGTPGGIPAELIDGYDVYLTDGTLLSPRVKLPSTPGATLSISSLLLKPARHTVSNVVVVLLDKYQNAWPQNWYAALPHLTSEKPFTAAVTNSYFDGSCTLSVTAPGRLTHPENGSSTFSTNSYSRYLEIAVTRIKDTNNVELSFAPVFNQVLNTPQGTVPANGNATWRTDVRPSEFWMTTTSNPRLLIGSEARALGDTTVVVTNKQYFNQIISVGLDYVHTYNVLQSVVLNGVKTVTTNVISTNRGVAPFPFLKLTVNDY